MAYPTPQRAQSSGMSAPAFEGHKKGSKLQWLKGLITVLIVVIILGAGVYALAGYTGIGFGGIKTSSEWQAVFLGNGQVYFGKVSSANKDFVTIKNIYYLQVITNQNTIGQPSDVQEQPEQQLTLIKLGNEIHGPKDEMLINRDQVVIIEDLKDDSRVVTAINDYIASQKK